MITGILQFFFCMTLALSLGIAVGHAGGYAIMYLDEYEVTRTIK
tara:strand:+ start:1992 stop:2123 length:132 start_codon:yes stop_codon:yes gene_type:complete